MFRFLNKIIHNNSLKKVAGSRGGQAAVVLILVIAVVLIFYAVTLNFGYFSQVKGMTTVASNTSAGMLASYMASYAQSLSEGQLRGKQKICALTGILAAIIGAIIVIVVTWLTWGTGTAQAMALAAKIIAIVGMVLATVSLVLQITVIQPGITSAWNRIIQKTLSLGNQFTENAIQSALSKVVTDNVSVPDVVDMDVDGLWVPDPSLGPPYDDKISRYAAYYNHRLKNIEDGPVDEIRKFLAALDEFLHQSCDDLTADWKDKCPGADGWGIHDPMGPDNPCLGSAECHPCCLPESETFDDVVFEIRPKECEDGDWETECGKASPYDSEYPWVYDPAYENPKNGFYSFRELIGKDDEHRDFYKDTPLTTPLCDPVKGWDPNCIPQNKHVDDNPSDRGFYLEDATNYYVSPAYTPDPSEKHKGIYPFFHKVANWGVELALLDYGGTLGPRECHWQEGGDPCAGKTLGPHPYPEEILPQLDLPLDPGSLTYNTTDYVDGENLVDGNPPLWVDNVPRPVEVLAESDICAEDFLSAPVDPETEEKTGFWKPGGDRFCSSDWPYSIECEKNTGDCGDGLNNCACRDKPGSESQFPDDPIDGLYIGLGDFITWAEKLLDQGRDSPFVLAANLPLWYPEVARWIEPLPSEGPCFLCNLENPPKEGHLHVFLKEMTEMRDRVESWTLASNIGAGCTEVWCVPPPRMCGPIVRPDEEAAFNPGAMDGPYGMIFDIVSCLNHNRNNDTRFAACEASCNACIANNFGECINNTNVACGGQPNIWEQGKEAYLPRSLIPEFRPFASFPIPDDYNSFPMPLETDPNFFGPPPPQFGEIAPFDPVGYEPSEDERGDYDPVNAPRLKELYNCQFEFEGVPGFCPACYESCTIAREACRVECRYKPGCGGRCEGDQDDCQDECNSNPDSPPSCLTGCNNERGRCDEECGVEKACDVDCVVDPDPAKGQNACNSACICESDVGIPDFSYNCEQYIMVSPTSPPESVPPPLRDEYDLEVCVAKGESCRGVTGSCDPSIIAPAESVLEGKSFVQLITDSALEAENQVAKFGIRRGFLSDRLSEAQGVVGILTKAIEKFDNFLSGPAEDLINARINFDDTDLGLPYHAIYGWKDNEKTSGADDGKWHIVKVEARTLNFCDNSCGFGQTSPDPEWPRIITYTKGWGTKRCYELVNTKGSVKFRTTRYDQEGDPETLKFPNGVPIWKFRTAHPKRLQGSGFSPDALGGGACAGASIQAFDDLSPTNGIYDGAFIMSKLQDSNAGCWNLAQKLLTRGVMSETCAQYSWMGDRMDFKFVKCKEF